MRSDEGGATSRTEIIKQQQQWHMHVLATHDVAAGKRSSGISSFAPAVTVKSVIVASTLKSGVEGKLTCMCHLLLYSLGASNADHGTESCGGICWIAKLIFLWRFM